MWQLKENAYRALNILPAHSTCLINIIIGGGIVIISFLLHENIVEDYDHFLEWMALNEILIGGRLRVYETNWTQIWKWEIRRHVWWVAEADRCGWDMRHAALWCGVSPDWKGASGRNARGIIGCMSDSHFILFCEQGERLVLFEEGGDMITHIFYDENSHIMQVGLGQRGCLGTI